MSWTDERINTLKKMWKEGKSAAEIAKTLGKGVTRNAVIGKAHRMGLSGRPSPIKKPAPVKKEPAAKSLRPALAAKPAPKAAPVAAAASKKTAQTAKAAPPSREVEELKKLESAAPQIGGGVALIDLTERMCKWPIGDPKDADFSFCGRTIRPGTPYCPEHAAMAYQASRNRGTAIGRGAKVVVEDTADEEVEDVADDAVDSDEDDDEAVA